MHRRFRPSWALSGIGIAIAAVGVSAMYSREMQTVARRIEVESTLVQTRHGTVEFAIRGDGPAVLVVHGAGGGYDQGNLIADAFGGEGFRWIVPSRFGYLRTPLPADASTAAQADAFADLLDGLGVDQVAVLAMSGGVPPSLQLAVRHPARVSGLVFLSSAPYTPLTAAGQKPPIPIWAYQALFESNFPYWLLQKVARNTLEDIFDVKPALRAALTFEEAKLVKEIVDAFQPVTRRTEGLHNEAAAIDPNTNYMLDKIDVPTLVIHAEDDGMNPFAIGEFTATHIRNARFIPLSSGGHLLLGHQAEVRDQVSAFLRQIAAPR